MAITASPKARRMSAKASSVAWNSPPKTRVTPGKRWGTSAKRARMASLADWDVACTLSTSA